MDTIDPRPVVLVIDDEVSIHRAFERLFRRGGIKIIGADDGDVGLDLARSVHPDLILLDVNMPRLDGRDVLTQLQADATLKDIPVVVITGRTDHLTRLQVLRDGAEDVVEKPFDPVMLRHRLTWMIEKRRAAAHAAH